MDNIKLSEIAIFDEWKQDIANKRKAEKKDSLRFCGDGIVNPTVWEQQDKKIILLLKEINDENGTFNDKMSLTKWLSDDISKKDAFLRKRIATWGNVSKWVYGLLHLSENPTWEQACHACGNYIGRFKQIQKICVVNMKKQPGKTKCSSATLTNYFYKYNLDFFIKQIRLYDKPDYIICGGKDVENLFCSENVLKGCYGNNCSIEKGHYENINYWIIDKRIKIIGFHHPQPYDGKLFKSYYDSLMLIAHHIQNQL